METSPVVFPLTDILLWARFALGLTLILWLPGYLLIGRSIRNRAIPQRIVLSVAAGSLLLPLWAQAMSAFGIGVRPWQYLPVALLGAAALGHSDFGRRIALAIDRDEPDPSWFGPSLLAPLTLGTVMLGLGFHDFVVPPTTHDAANHAFMTLRITEVGTVDATQVFGAPFGGPDLPYALGLHTIASLIAQTGGLPPYIAVWFLALSAVAFLPVSLSLLWDDWEFSPNAILLGALFVAGSAFAPGRVLWWGLFGTAVGLFLVPFLSLLLARFWANASVGAGLAAGAATGSLMLIHGSEVPTAGFVTLVTLATQRSRPDLSPRGWFAFAGSMTLCGWFFLATIVPSYLSGGIEGGDKFVETAHQAFEQTRTAFGNSILLQSSSALVIVFAAFDRRARPAALFTLGVLAVATCVALFQDPISSLLTTPYYRQPERTRYQLVFGLPILLGFAVHWLSSRDVFASRGTPAHLIVSTLLIGAMLGPDLPDSVRAYREKIHFAPFSPDDFRQSHEIAALLEEGEWIANQFFDGSSWLLHVDGIPLLVPTGWQISSPEGVSNRAAVNKLVRGLRFDELDPRFAYLYVSDLRTGKPRGFTRARAARLGALEPVLIGVHSTLYRIRRARN